MFATAIILTYTVNEEAFKITNDCISSLISSEPFITFEVLVLESNKDFNDLGFTYTNSSQIEVLVPDCAFNFHKFLNIGIQKASNELIILSNNDIIYNKSWLTEILNVRKNHRDIMSFSPYDLLSPFHKKKFSKLEDDFVCGYTVREEIAGYCIVVDKKIFQIMDQLLDERFNFYYADDDYAMMLRRYQIKHALVRNSRIEHLGSRNTKILSKQKSDSDPQPTIEVDKSLPKYLYSDDYKWIVKNKKMLHGFLTFHRKWGNRRALGLKYRIEKVLAPLKLKWLIKMMYYHS